MLTVRRLDFLVDREALAAFLSSDDARRLELLQPAVDSGDCLVFVAAQPTLLVGWAVVHLRFRDDVGWVMDADTVRFQSGESAYLEYLEVRAQDRGRGVGKSLLMAIEAATQQSVKRTLWLHTGEANLGAQRFYRREGWQYVSTVAPSWRAGALMQIYSKSLMPSDKENVHD